MATSIIGSVTSGSGKKYDIKYDESSKDIYIDKGGWTNIGKAPTAKAAIDKAYAWLLDK